MLSSLKQLYGDKLGAADGEIGQVKDFYFDDQDWVIRYLVVDTGTWLSERQVLISPRVLGRLDQVEKIQRAKLTRKQIEACPPIETHKPVSRQYEEEYYRHYGLPSYWQGDGLWGISDFPILKSPAKVSTAAPATRPKRGDAHLRSTQAVNGYVVQTTDGPFGHICDFMVDAESWAIGKLVVRTGHRLSGKDILISTESVSRVSYEESTVFVDLTQAAAEQSPVHPAA
jgi:PRC-barrel domain